jgi:threonyl-tRNA synthetase
VQKKIRNAELDWTPISIGVGSEELETEKLAVRFRETGKIEKINKEDLIKYIKTKTADKPYKLLSLPKLISKRPIFIG